MSRKTLRIGGLIKLSTLDYPGLISAVIFTQGCNFTCPYCHNPDLVRPFGEILDEAGVLDFLKSRRNRLDAVVISGGEPTLASDLGEFLKVIKGYGYRIKLDTNGSFPDRVSNLLERRLVDYVALDLKGDPGHYPPSMTPVSLAPAVLETLNLLKRTGRPHEFRTTVVFPFITRKTIEALALAATGQAPLYLQRFRPERILDPEFMSSYPDQPDPETLVSFCQLANRYLPCHIR